MGVKFQSTLPVGGATRIVGHYQEIIDISIHAPRGGSDGGATASEQSAKAFQSTLPVGGATCTQSYLYTWGGISIHAPRGGSD